MGELPTLTYHAYLVLYDLAYMLDDALVLLSGAVMLALGGVLLVEPDWLLGGE
jgi:hypothetical protein